MIHDINHLIESAVTEVFATMLGLSVKTDPSGGALANGEPHVASSVGFIGESTGVVFLYSTNRFAQKVTHSLLGLDPTDPPEDDMVNDAMGELANMVVGHVKSRLTDRGMPCVLTIPSIVRGNHFCIEPVADAERCVLLFRCQQDELLVEIMMKKNGVASRAVAGVN